MTNEEIREKYPFLVTSKDTTWLNSIPEGWYELVLDLCRDISFFVDNSFEIFDMKEKWYQLRIYHNSDDPRVEQLINEAEKESASICAVCGKSLEKPGGYICKDCQDEIRRQYESKD